MDIRQKIYNDVTSVHAYDEIEKSHMQEVGEWIDGGVEIFRIAKPATPPQHLVSYTLLCDLERQKIFLVHHRLAEIWLPAGGHVDAGEDPTSAAVRELKEELAIIDQPTPKLQQPFFLTKTQTVGDNVEKHTDVSLWFVFESDSTQEIGGGADFEREFADARWFGFDEILAMDIATLDIHMHRFIQKLRHSIAESE